MEVPIIVKSEVECPMITIKILLSICRGCMHYRYETVCGKVFCNFVPVPKRIKP